MARTRSPRFNLWRWSSDDDTQDRSDFDEDNSEIEARGAKFGQGTLAGKGVAAAANSGTFWIIDDAAGGGVIGDVWYSTGAAWQNVGSIDQLRTRLITAKADLLVGSAPGAVAKLPKSGVDNRVLTESAAAPYGMDWLPPAAADLSGLVAKATLTAKGTLIGASAAGTPATVPVAAGNNFELVSDSSAATGVTFRRRRYRRAFLTMGA